MNDILSPTITAVPWTPFTHADTVYDLGHLHPCELMYEQPRQGEKPAITYIVDVTFSLHCFTRSLPKEGAYDRSLVYRSSLEERLFDTARYEYSKRLPGIIRTLNQRKCMKTGHGNFFTVEVITDDGNAVDYDVFFTAEKSSKRGRITLFIQSAFVREKKKLPTGKPIRFAIILYNTLNKRPISP
jgi:hypothetical protein